MNAVKDDVTALVQKELDAANEVHPLFHSSHEGYAVLLEEITELEIEQRKIKSKMDFLWNEIRCNNDDITEQVIKDMHDNAIAAACEAIQIAAMCDKWEMSAEKWRK